MRLQPNWKIRRRYIFAAFAVGVGMILSAVVAVWQDKIGAGDLITGGVALITLILTSYIFGAAWEDKTRYSKDEVHPDG